MIKIGSLLMSVKAQTFAQQNFHLVLCIRTDNVFMSAIFHLRILHFTRRFVDGEIFQRRTGAMHVR